MPFIKIINLVLQKNIHIIESWEKYFEEKGVITRREKIGSKTALYREIDEDELKEIEKIKEEGNDEEILDSFRRRKRRTDRVGTKTGRQKV